MLNTAHTGTSESLREDESHHGTVSAKARTSARPVLNTFIVRIFTLVQQRLVLKLGNGETKA